MTPKLLVNRIVYGCLWHGSHIASGRTLPLEVNPKVFVGL